MANQRWNERGRDDDRGWGRRDDDRDRDRDDRRDDSEGSYGRRQFSDDANQGGYAQGQYARERGRHEQSGYGHGGRDGQGGAGQGVHRQHWMAQDDDRNRADWESSRYGGGGGWARGEQGGGSGGGQREGGWGREGGGRGGSFERGGYAQHAYEDRGRWSGRDDEHRGNFGRGFDARGRDGVGREGPGERGMSWAGGPVDDWGRRNDGPWSRERGGMSRDRDDRGFGTRGLGTRGYGADEEPRYRPDIGGRPGGSPWHHDDDRSPSGGIGRHGRSGLDYGRFDNDDQDIRSHGGKFKSRDDDDHRYGMGLQGGAGRGRWWNDPRDPDDDPDARARDRGSWGRQVWAEDERYGTRGGEAFRRPDDRDLERRAGDRGGFDRGFDRERGAGMGAGRMEGRWDMERSVRHHDDDRGGDGGRWVERPGAGHQGQERWEGPRGRADATPDEHQVWRGGVQRQMEGRQMEGRQMEGRQMHGRSYQDRGRDEGRSRDEGSSEGREGGGGSRDVGGRGPSARQEGRRIDRDAN